jgi:uncharacterized protein DUF3515
VFPSDAAQPAGAPRWPIWIALALTVALVVGVLIAAAMVRGQALGPLGLAGVPAPSAGSTNCARLLAALPEKLDEGETGGLGRRQLAAPAPAGAAGWGEPPVVLRCGLERPADLTATSRLLEISGVRFLDIVNPGTSTWVAVDRPVYVAVALPPTSGSGPLQQIASVIANTLPRQDVAVAR